MCQPITKSQGREYLLSGNKAIKYEKYIITWLSIITPQLIQSRHRESHETKQDGEQTTRCSLTYKQQCDHKQKWKVKLKPACSIKISAFKQFVYLVLIVRFGTKGHPSSTYALHNLVCLCVFICVSFLSVVQRTLCFQLSNQVSFIQLFVMSLWCCWSSNLERHVALLGRWLPIEGDSLHENGKHTNFRSSR